MLTKKLTGMTPNEEHKVSKQATPDDPTTGLPSGETGTPMAGRSWSQAFSRRAQLGGRRPWRSQLSQTFEKHGCGWGRTSTSLVLWEFE